MDHVGYSISTVNQNDVWPDHDIAISSRRRAESLVKARRYGANHAAHVRVENITVPQPRLVIRPPVSLVSKIVVVTMLAIPTARFLAVIIVELAAAMPAPIMPSAAILIIPALSIISVVLRQRAASAQGKQHRRTQEYSQNWLHRIPPPDFGFVRRLIVKLGPSWIVVCRFHRDGLSMSFRRTFTCILSRSPISSRSHIGQIP
jgi:hypothetical protein